LGASADAPPTCSTNYSHIVVPNGRDRPASGEDFLLVLVFLIAEEIICKSPPVLFSSSAAYTVSSPEGERRKNAC
jgi:hypothetical protein